MVRNILKLFIHFALKGVMWDVKLSTKSVSLQAGRNKISSQKTFHIWFTMKTRFTSLDLAAELSVLQRDVVGMRVNQVYDIDHKSYILKLQERSISILNKYIFYLLVWHYQNSNSLETREKDNAAVREWCSDPHHRVRVAQELRAFRIFNETKGWWFNIYSCT